MTIRPDFEKWQQSAADMRQLAIEAPHRRSRERFQALYMIGTGQSNARQWAQEIQRDPQTVHTWVHGYNEHGPEWVSYQRSGGRQAKLDEAETAQIIETVKHTTPLEHDLPGHGWTLKKRRRWVEEKLGRPISRTTLRNLLKAAGLSWKKRKKALAKADPKARAAFVARFQGWYEQVCRGELRLIYVDEVHRHQDLDLGYRWSERGIDDGVPSHGPPLKNRLNWYGAYDFTQGQCFIWHDGPCDGDHTVAFLDHLAQWLGPSDQEILIIWDGASYHNRWAQVRHHAAQLGFSLVQLPAYSPDLNPIEGLWKWMREDLTQHHCFQYLYQLERACFDFIDRLNLDPQAILSRLWPKFVLDPAYEKVLVSN